MFCFCFKFSLKVFSKHWKFNMEGKAVWPQLERSCIKLGSQYRIYWIFENNKGIGLNTVHKWCLCSCGMCGFLRWSQLLQSSSHSRHFSLPVAMQVRRGLKLMDASSCVNGIKAISMSAHRQSHDTYKMNTWAVVNSPLHQLLDWTPLHIELCCNKLVSL